MLDEKKFEDFSQVLHYWADKKPNKVFVHDVTANKKFTYRQFNNLVNQAVRLMEEKGVKKGDFVQTCLRNSCEYLILYFASIRLGSTINSLPNTLSEKEIIQNIQFIKPKIIFLEKEKSKEALNKHKKIVFIVEYKGKDSFIGKLKKYSGKKIDRKIDENSPACLYYSSGTTGNPKGMLCSRRGQITLIASCCRGYKHTSDRVHFGFLPMAHTAIINYSLLPVLFMGSRLVFAENFMKIRKDFWKIIQDYGIGYVETVPTVVFLILHTKHPAFDRKKFKLPFVACGSAVLTPKTQEEFEKKFGLPLINKYGLSETGQMTFDDPDRPGRKNGTVGKPMDIVKIKVFDDKGRQLPPGEVGEFGVKTKAMFSGYYKNEKLYKSCFKNGWFMTGDLGRIDKDGLIYYVDRTKDLIIKGGMNICPNQIDEVLAAHPAVREAASIGKPDKLFGEVIKSYVVLAPGKKIDKQKLIDYCRQELGEAKTPSEIEFTDKIPQGYSGKILRKELRQRNK